MQINADFRNDLLVQCRRVVYHGRPLATLLHPPHRKAMATSRFSGYFFRVPR